MTRRLDNWRIGEIKEMFAGRVIAFAAIVAERGAGLGIAEANIRGYTPVPLGWYLAETFDEASAEAERLNREALELDSKDAVRIVCSSMAEQNRQEAEESDSAERRMEKRIARKIISDAIAGGYELTVDDGEDQPVKFSRDAKEVFEALFSVDAEHLIVSKDRKRVGAVFLVHGNDGFDVICDYSTSLEGVLAGANALAETLAREAA